jgi:hypothetical protein
MPNTFEEIMSIVLMEPKVIQEMIEKGYTLTVLGEDLVRIWNDEQPLDQNEPFILYFIFDSTKPSVGRSTHMMGQLEVDVEKFIGRPVTHFINHWDGSEEVTKKWMILDGVKPGYKCVVGTQAASNMDKRWVDLTVPTKSGQTVLHRDQQSVPCTSSASGSDYLSTYCATSWSEAMKSGNAKNMIIKINATTYVTVPV